MLVKILGLVDFISALFLFLIGLNMKMPNTLIIIFGVVLLVKGMFIFFGDFVSLMDLYAGILLILSLSFTIPRFLIIIAVFLLLQKAFFSLVG